MQEKLPTHGMNRSFFFFLLTDLCFLRVPADGRREIIETRFLHPKTILEECRGGRIRCMPPQFYILSTLVDILSSPISTPEQWEETERLSSGVFGKTIFIPRKLGQDKDGRTILALEGDEMYGGPIGCRHRILGKIVQGGVKPLFKASDYRLIIVFFSPLQTIDASALIRNFDILDGIESQAYTHGVAKLWWKYIYWILPWFCIDRLKSTWQLINWKHEVLHVLKCEFKGLIKILGLLLIMGRSLRVPM